MGADSTVQSNLKANFCFLSKRKKALETCTLYKSSLQNNLHDIAFKIYKKIFLLKNNLLCKVHINDLEP